MRSPACLQLVQTNSTNIQGKGVSYDFTIDPADQAKPLSVQFDFNASSTFVAANGITAPLNDGTTTTNAGNSDIEVFLYDVTNSQLIYCTPQVITANGANNFTFKGIFQTASNSTSYRLIFHVATANANATGWTFKFANVYVGPQVVLQGPPITDWTQNTAFTFDNLGTVTGNTAYIARHGDTLWVRGAVTAGTEVAAVAAINLPFGSIDYTKIVSGTNVAAVGYFGLQTSASTNLLTGGQRPLTLFVDGTTTNKIYFAISTASNAFVKANGSALGGNSTVINYEFQVPIAGWSSTTLMSNDASTRPIVAQAQYTLNGTVGANTAIPYDTIMYDNSGSFTSGTGAKFTAPVAGVYKVSTEVTSSSASTLQLYKNGSLYSYLVTYPNTQSPLSGTCDIKLNAGDFIDIRPAGSSAYTIAGAGNSVSISLVQGPSAIAATEKVYAQYTSTSTAAASTTTPITYGTKVVDSHNAFNGTIFTAPRAGVYIITASYYSTTSSNSRIYKNGSYLYQGSTGTATALPILSAQVFLNAGEFIDIRPDASVTLGNTANIAYIQISSQGGI